MYRFTLTFDSSPIKGEGDSVGCVVLLLPCPVDSRLRGNDRGGVVGVRLIDRMVGILLFRFGFRGVGILGLGFVVGLGLAGCVFFG